MSHHRPGSISVLRVPTAMSLRAELKVYSLYKVNLALEIVFHPLTLITFLFPFPAAGGGGAPPGPAPTAEFSAAFIPAFTVSINTPDEIAGDNVDTRLLNGGLGIGGIGNRRPPRC